MEFNRDQSSLEQAMFTNAKCTFNAKHQDLVFYIPKRHNNKDRRKLLMLAKHRFAENRSRNDSRRELVSLLQHHSLSISVRICVL